MTLDEILTVTCVVCSAVGYVVYRLTNEKKYFDYVNQVVGR